MLASRPRCCREAAWLVSVSAYIESLARAYNGSFRSCCSIPLLRNSPPHLGFQRTVKHACNVLNTPCSPTSRIRTSSTWYSGLSFDTTTTVGKLSKLEKGCDSLWSGRWDGLSTSIQRQLASQGVPARRLGHDCQRMRTNSSPQQCRICTGVCYI